MKKNFHIPLLAALPALLAGCTNQQEPDISRYQRIGYNSYEQCMQAYQPQVQQGLQNPCYQNRSYGSGGSVGFYRFYGPYTYNDAQGTRFVGYDSSGNPAATGLRQTTKGSYSSFRSATSRGGFTSSSRGGGSFGG